MTFFSSWNSLHWPFSRVFLASPIILSGVVGSRLWPCEFMLWNLSGSLSDYTMLHHAVFWNQHHPDNAVRVNSVHCTTATNPFSILNLVLAVGGVWPIHAFKTIFPDVWVLSIYWLCLKDALFLKQLFCLFFWTLNTLNVLFYFKNESKKVILLSCSLLPLHILPKPNVCAAV